MFVVCVGRQAFNFIQLDGLRQSLAQLCRKKDPGDRQGSLRKKNNLEEGENDAERLNEGTKMFLMKRGKGKGKGKSNIKLPKNCVASTSAGQRLCENLMV